MVAGGPVGLTCYALGGGLHRCSLLPSSSLQVVRIAHTFLSGQPRQGLACRPCSGWPPAVVSKSHPSGKSGDMCRPRQWGSLFRRCRREPGQVYAACPSRPVLAAVRASRGGGGGLAERRGRAERTAIERRDKLKRVSIQWPQRPKALKVCTSRPSSLWYMQFQAARSGPLLLCRYRMTSMAAERSPFRAETPEKLLVSQPAMPNIRLITALALCCGAGSLMMIFLSYLNMHFFYVKSNILRERPNILLNYVHSRTFFTPKIHPPPTTRPAT